MEQDLDLHEQFCTDERFRLQTKIEDFITFIAVFIEDWVALHILYIHQVYHL